MLSMAITKGGCMSMFWGLFIIILIQGFIYSYIGFKKDYDRMYGYGGGIVAGAIMMLIAVIVTK